MKLVGERLSSLIESGYEACWRAVMKLVEESGYEP